VVSTTTLLSILVWLIVRDPKHLIVKGKFASQHVFIAGLKRLVASSQTWLISIYSGLAFVPISAFGGLWGVPFLMRDYGLTRTGVAGLVSLIFIGFAVGSPLAGWLSDRIGRRKPIMMVGTVLGCGCLLLILLVPPMPISLLGIALLLFGFFTSFFFVSFAVVREINQPQSGGTAIGFINMFNALCGAFSGPLIGGLLDIGWTHQALHGIRIFPVTDYQMALATLPLSMLIGLVLLIFVKETYCKQQ